MGPLWLSMLLLHRELYGDYAADGVVSGHVAD
jgi:hypothetical protein